MKPTEKRMMISVGISSRQQDQPTEEISLIMDLYLHLNTLLNTTKYSLPFQDQINKQATRQSSQARRQKK